MDNCIGEKTKINKLKRNFPQNKMRNKRQLRSFIMQITVTIRK